MATQEPYTGKMMLDLHPKMQLFKPRRTRIQDGDSELCLVLETWQWLRTGFGWKTAVEERLILLSLLWNTCEFWVGGGHACVHLCAWWTQLVFCGTDTHLGGYQGKQVLKKRYIFIKCWYLWCAFILILTQVLSLTELSNEKQNLLDILQDFIPRVSKPESMNDYGCSTFLPFFSPKPKPFLLLAWEQCTGIISLYLQPTCFWRPLSSLCSHQACTFSMCPCLWWLVSSLPGEQTELIYLRGFLFWWCLEDRSRCENN